MQIHCCSLNRTFHFILKDLSIFIAKKWAPFPRIEHANNDEYNQDWFYDIFIEKYVKRNLLARQNSFRSENSIKNSAKH